MIMTTDDEKQVYISTSEQYDEAFFDLIDYFNSKDFNLIETIGILEMLKDHIIEQHQSDERFDAKRGT